MLSFIDVDIVFIVSGLCRRDSASCRNHHIDVIVVIHSFIHLSYRLLGF